MSNEKPKKYVSKDQRKLRINHNILTMNDEIFNDLNFTEDKPTEFISYDLQDKLTIKNIKKFYTSEKVKYLYLVELQEDNQKYLVRYNSELQFLLHFYKKNHKEPNDMKKLLIDNGFIIEEKQKIIILDHNTDIK